MAFSPPKEDYPHWMSKIVDELLQFGFEWQNLEDFHGPGVLLRNKTLEGSSKNGRTLFIMGKAPRFGNFISSIKKIYAYCSMLGKPRCDVFIQFRPNQEFVKISSKRHEGIKFISSLEEVQKYSRVLVHYNFFATKNDEIGALANSAHASEFASKSIRVHKDYRVSSSSLRGNLLIHIRAGDIFHENPHPGYSQPPLGFYQAVVRDNKPNFVKLFIEDFGNPVVIELLRHLHDEGIATELHGSDLGKTVASLRVAENVVFGQGSFVPQILSLSSSIKSVYLLDGFFSFPSGWKNQANKVIYECRDQNIVNLKPWRGDTNQINLMTSIGIEHFEVGGGNLEEEHELQISKISRKISSWF